MRINMALYYNDWFSLQHKPVLDSLQQKPSLKQSTTQTKF